MQIRAERVRRLRQRHGLSQQELAIAADLHVRTIQRIETGAPASLESAKALSAVFSGFGETIEENDMTGPTQLSIPSSGSRIAGFVGLGLGVAGGLAGVVADAFFGGITPGAAGLYLGALGAMTGVAAALIANGLGIFRLQH